LYYPVTLYLTDKRLLKVKEEGISSGNLNANGKLNRPLLAIQNPCELNPRTARV
jgi:hypothetical protein